jgi:hypothetical protein
MSSSAPHLDVVKDQISKLPRRDVNIIIPVDQRRRSRSPEPQTPGFFNSTTAATCRARKYPSNKYPIRPNTESEVMPVIV